MTSRTFNLILVVVLAAALVAIAWSAPRAAEQSDRYPPTHQLVICEPGKPCLHHGRPSGATACALNLASERLQRELPSGTVLICAPVRR